MHAPQWYADPPGLEVSPGDVLRDLLVEAQLGNQALQLAVLLIQLFQSLGLVHLQTAIFLAPAIVGLFR